MISFDNFIITDGSPLYSQIVLYIKRGVAAGNICHGDELPSRRVLSALLGVNPNTVQKAYRLLEEEGLIASHGGAKSLVTVEGEKADLVREELLAGDAQSYVAAMKRMGVTKEDALALVGQLWD